MSGVMFSSGGRNELDQCEQLCETALRVSDGKKEEASMILAEVKYPGTSRIKHVQHH